jgi:hypothetical protein
VNETLGLVLKTKEDLELVRGQTLNNLIGLAVAQA